MLRKKWDEPENKFTAVAGALTMLENEIEPVIKALVENGNEIVAVHNHMVHETPKIFFLHCWGGGSSAQLLKGLKSVLEKTSKAIAH